MTTTKTTNCVGVVYKARNLSFGQTTFGRRHLVKRHLAKWGTINHNLTPNLKSLSIRCWIRSSDGQESSLPLTTTNHTCTCVYIIIIRWCCVRTTNKSQLARRTRSLLSKRERQARNRADREAHATYHPNHQHLYDLACGMNVTGSPPC